MRVPGIVSAGHSRGLYLLLLIVASCLAGLAQAAAAPFQTTSGGHSFRTWTTETGLPQNSVQCVIQAADGYLWVGTRGGVARFDGVRFTTFEEELPPEVAPGFAKGFAIDSAGALWIASKRAILRHDNHGFTVFSAADGLCHEEVTCVCQESKGGVWVGTGGGLSRIRNGRVESFPASSLSRPFIHAVSESRSGQVWVGSGDGLARFDPATGLYNPVWSTPRKPYTESNIVRFVLADAQDDVWFGTDEVMCRWHDGQIDAVPGGNAGSDDRLQSLYADSAGRIWLVKANGLYRIEEGRAVQFQAASPLADSQLTCMTYDREGNCWIGTGFGGLSRMRSRVLQVLTTHSGLAENEIWSVSPARQGGVWAASSGGLIYFSENGSEKLPIPAALPRQSFRSAIQDKRGDLWIATAFDGYFQLHQSSAGFAYVPKLAVYPQSRVIGSDRAGNIWVGTKGGLSKTVPRRRVYWSDELLCQVLDTHSEEWHFRPDEFCRCLDGTVLSVSKGQVRLQGDAAPAGERISTGSELLARDQEGWTTQVPSGELSDYDVQTLLQDHSGAIWFGTAAGLSRLADGRFDSFTIEDGLASNDILSLYEDSSRVLWVGTAQGLSWRALSGRPSVGHDAAPSDNEKTHFYSCTARQGLFDDRIDALVADDLGYLWLGCHRGIFRLRKGELDEFAQGRRTSVHGFALGEADGMLSAQVSGGGQPAACKTEDGKLWFATARGVVLINPSEVRQNALPPPVLIEGVRVNGQPKVLRPGQGPLRQPSGRAQRGQLSQASDPLILRPGSGRLLEVQYTATSLSAPERVRFKYRLEGHDQAWIDAGSRRTAYYTNLRPGRYRFRVIACNNHNVWNNEGATLALIVSPFLFEAWWFRTLSIVAVLAGGWAAVQVRLRRVQKMHELEKHAARTEERRRIARDLHDRIGSHLTRLVIGDVAGESAESPAKAALAQEALHSLDEVVWLTDPRKDTLQHTVEYLGRQAREFLSGTPLQLRLDVPLEIPTAPLTAAVRHQLLRIFEEALNNAFKHSGATEVILGLALTPTAFRIYLKDNGSGLPPSGATGYGNGLQNMRERAVEAGGVLTIESAPAAGTAISVELPLLQ